MEKKTILFLFTIVIFYNVQGQGDLTEKDKKEIQFNAELYIQQFISVLNTLSNNKTTDYESSEVVINNTINPSPKQIFENGNVVIENDIDPNNSQTGTDIRIKDYLEEFRLLYKKSDHNTITISKIKASEPKKDKYVFIDLFYEKRMTGNHKTIPESYQLIKRVATLRSEPGKNGEWTSKITGVSFYNPDNPSHQFANSDTIIPPVNVILPITDSITTIEEPIKIEETKTKTNKLVFETVISESYKKGENVHINWSGGDGGPINFQLINNNGADILLNKKVSGGTWNVPIPKNIPTGSEYQFKIKDEKGIEKTSNHFEIKRKIPLVYKVVPVAILAGVITYIIFHKPPPSSNLPGPPHPGEN